MSEIRLQVQHLSKSFGITKAVRDVSFNVNKGEVHALIGENGSGKSTLTNMLTGIYTIDSGKFILDGKEVLVATVLGTLIAPVRGLATVLDANISGLARVINAIAEQKGA